MPCSQKVRNVFMGTATKYSSYMAVLVLTGTNRFLFVWNGTGRTLVAVQLRVPGLNGAQRTFFAARRRQYWVRTLSPRVRAWLARHCATDTTQNVLFKADDRRTIKSADFIGRRRIGQFLYVTRPILSADISAINLAVELVLISPRKSGDKIGR